MRNQGITRIESQAMIDQATADMRAEQAQLLGVQSALRSTGIATTGGTGAGALPSATTAGATPYCVWMAIVKPKISGLYDLRIAWAVTGITTADSILYEVTTDYSLTNAPVITGGTAFGGQQALTPAPANIAMYTNQGVAGGITYTNGHTGAPGVLMYTTGAQVAVTTALNQMGGFVGTVGVSLTAAGAPVPAKTALGTTALPAYMMIGLYTTISAGAVTWQALSVDIAERYA